MTMTTEESTAPVVNDPIDRVDPSCPAGRAKSDPPTPASTRPLDRGGVVAATISLLEVQPIGKGDCLLVRQKIDLDKKGKLMIEMNVLWEIVRS
jgi:hypothetical protein